MRNSYLLQLIALLILMTFLFSCGSSSNVSQPIGTHNLNQIWNGIWVSNKLFSTGTFSMKVIQMGEGFIGSITMTGNPCFSAATIAGWTVIGNSVTWTSPEIGNFAGTISGAAISGTYSVTAAGACLGDTGVFSVTS